jgi:hypothetical protein
MLENLICGSLIYAGSCDIKRRQTVMYRAGSMSNPFMAYDDGFEWPDLYTECDEMLESCVLVYLLSELRSLAKQGEATNKTMKVLQMPLAAKDLMRVINSSRELLTTTYSGCGEFAAYKTKFSTEMLKTADERLMRIKKRRKKQRNQPLLQQSPSNEDSETAQEENTDLPSKPIVSPTMFISFEDDFKKEELYYAIGVNHQRKRITMCFRGYAVSNLDWATDFDSYMREVKNPMKMHSSQQPTMKIHSKLHDLLYAEFSQRPQWGGGGSSTNSSRGGEVWTEFMEMLQNKIRPITNNYPGYKVSKTSMTHRFFSILWWF